MTLIVRIFADHVFIGQRGLLPWQGAIAAVAEDEQEGPARVDPRWSVRSASSVVHEIAQPHHR